MLIKDATCSSRGFIGYLHIHEVTNFLFQAVFTRYMDMRGQACLFAKVLLKLWVVRYSFASTRHQTPLSRNYHVSLALIWKIVND